MKIIAVTAYKKYKKMWKKKIKNILGRKEKLIYSRINAYKCIKSYTLIYRRIIGTLNHLGYILLLYEIVCYFTSLKDELRTSIL